MAPDVKAAVALEPYIGRVLFVDGEVRDVDVEPILDGPVFTPLRDVEEFRKVGVDEETRTVAWPNGADLDPDVIYGLYESDADPAARIRTPDHAS
jgi:hypothetical protein